MKPAHVCHCSLSSGSRDAFGRCVDPVGLCAAIGVSLRVLGVPLRAKGREVFGAWDPLLRRIELFGVTPDLPDEQLVRTFAHELSHAARRPRLETHATRRFLRFRSVDEETAADELADTLLHTLAPECIVRWAAALHELVRLPQGNESAVWP